jgi:hypothetical protein
MTLNDLGICPTGEHVKHPQCGYIGCVDLRAWAKAKRYRYQLEESYQAESHPHVRGDGRWYVEIVCQRGLIYPVGGLDLAAFTESVHAWRELLEVEGIRLRAASRPQAGDGEYRCRFPVSQLDAVARILRPKRRRSLDPDRARAISGLKEVHAQGRKTAQETTQG